MVATYAWQGIFSDLKLWKLADFQHPQKQGCNMYIILYIIWKSSYSLLGKGMSQCPWDLSGRKKKFELCGYNPKFLHYQRVNLSLKSKFFNQPIFRKCVFKFSCYLSISVLLSDSFRHNFYSKNVNLRIIMGFLSKFKAKRILYYVSNQV